MEHFEKEALRKTLKKAEVWFRYVNNTFVIWRHGRAELRKFLIFLNNQHSDIHFTMNIEKNGKFPFLDVLISKKAVGTLGQQVYRKPIHTDRYLHTTTQHKKSAINSFVQTFHHLWLKNSLTKKQTRQKRYNQKRYNQQTRQWSLTHNQTKRILSILPYVKRTTDWIGRTLNTIRTIFKSSKKDRTNLKKF